jgi:dipeptidyl aminopeptidase/acylaminoacyl peptidase
VSEDIAARRFCAGIPLTRLARGVLTIFLASGLARQSALAGSNEEWWPSFGSGTNVARKVAEFKEHPDFVVGGIDFNGDGTQLATNGLVAPPEVHIWNWRDPSRVARVLLMNAPAGNGRSIRYNADGSRLAVGHDRGRQLHDVIRIWNTGNWTVNHDIAEPVGSEMGFEFSSDGKLFVRTTFGSVSGAGPSVIVHRTTDWDQVEAFSTKPFWPRTITLSSDGKLAAVGGPNVSFGPNGSYPLVNHPQILIIDLSSQQVLRTIAAFPDNNEIQTLSWSPDGRILAAGALVTESAPGPDAVKIFDPSTGKQMFGGIAKEGEITGLRYSANGRYLVGGVIDGKVNIWEAQDDKLLQVIPVDEHFPAAVSISRDSRYLAIANRIEIAVYELK